MTINPKVIDISHYDALVGDGFDAVRKAGIVGVIHKASEGLNVVDVRYATRRMAAKAAGLLWGAYHFIRPGDAKAQAEFFLRAARPDDQTLVSLDFEVRTVAANAAREFIEHVEEKLGRKVVLYSGNTIKEDLGTTIDPWWAAHRLWLAHYASKWLVQRSWSTPWLWQFTGDGAGPKPHQIPGIAIAGGLDISSYDGSDEQLRAEWASDATHVAVAVAPHPAAAITDAGIFHDVVMTEFGGPGDRQPSAYGGMVDPDMPGVALPYRFRGARPIVRVMANGKATNAPVVDVGPWFTDDAWFATTNRRPRAEAVKRTNKAGIDATPATWAALGMPGRGLAKVDVRILPAV